MIQLIQLYQRGKKIHNGGTKYSNVFFKIYFNYWYNFKNHFFL